MTNVEAPELDSRHLRQAFATFPSGIAAICGHDGQAPVGMAVSSFVSVSLAPPLVSVCMQDTSTTWPRLRELPRLGVSVLAADQQGVSAALASRNGDRFAGWQWRQGAEGGVFVEGAAGWFDCTIHAEVPAGDHSVVLLRVHDLGVGEAAPLVFHGSRYRQLAIEIEVEAGR
ncbi:flavin reductase family protein [Nocardia miyunensis]|uniref:flavin reductase family protein n=1 Tax=Nocardia miyunensis TaxID=282684 RepID=UPI00083272E2|nr:flavin reductase family protein [Nocardia miyunensis]